MAISEVTKDLRRLLDAQKLEVSIIHSIDDYSSEAGMPKTPEEILEVLGRHGAK